MDHFVNTLRPIREITQQFRVHNICVAMLGANVMVG